MSSKTVAARWTRHWLSRAETLDGLARIVGVAPDGLVDTVRRWNGLVASGRDLDFERGDSSYDGWSGDHAHLGTRRATLGPIDEPPFYAVELHSGTLGTKGGPRTTVDGNVIELHGNPIPELYAAGNAMAATGMVYGGAGGTLGPAITFGYLAGRHAASFAPKMAANA